MKFNSETGAQSGAKSKRGESKIAKLMRESADIEDTLRVFITLRDLALSGEMDAIKTYMAYVVGKPKESMDLTTNGKDINQFLIEIIDSTGQTENTK